MGWGERDLLPRLFILSHPHHTPQQVPTIQFPLFTMRNRLREAVTCPGSNGQEGQGWDGNPSSPPRPPPASLSPPSPPPPRPRVQQQQRAPLALAPHANRPHPPETVTVPSEALVWGSNSVQVHTRPWPYHPPAKGILCVVLEMMLKKFLFIVLHTQGQHHAGKMCNLRKTRFL